MNSSWKWVMALVAALVVGWQTSPASAQVTLKRMMPKGKTLMTNNDTIIEQTLSLAGQNIETKSEQNAVQSAKYSAEANGNTAVEHKLEAIQLRLKTGGMEFMFDSANPDKGTDSEIGKQIAKSLQVGLKAPWTAVHDANGKVLEIKGIDKLTEGLDEQSAAMLKAQLKPEYLKERLSNEADRIPSTPVKVGDTWEKAQSLQIGGGQSLAFKRKFKYAGQVERDGKKLHRIEISTSEVTYAIGADSPLPLKLKNSDLKVTESKGEILFDGELGRVVEENDKVRMKGKLTFEIATQELPGELDLTITSTQKERP